jgi:hypothetical protein
MERRKAVLAAATASLTLLAGAAAISLVGASGDDGVGQISPVDPATTPDTIYVDEPAAGPTTAPSRSSDGRGDPEDELDRDEDDGHEDEGRGDDTADDDDSREYEGADDDD